MGEEVISPIPDEEEDLSYLFTLDKNPSHIADDLDIPTYSSKFMVLKEKDEVVKEPKNNTRPSAVTCWNCGGDHNLRDCTKPRNYAKIAQKRAESQAKYTKAVRYHADEEQKHPHLRPGSISDRLREALGLRPDQAPFFIYRMRELGYPPGWVEEAKVYHSGLSMFDSSGQKVKDPDLEDGEIINQRDRDKYDFRKLIEYPGFNVPFEPEITDETELWNAQPMRESQSIKHMQKLWSGKQSGSYKRKRLKMQSSNSESPSVSTSYIPPEEEDMELDAEQEEVKFLPPTDNCGFVPPLPESSPVKAPLPPTLPSSKEARAAKNAAKRKKRNLILANQFSPPRGDEEVLDEGKLATKKKKTSTKNNEEIDLAGPTVDLASPTVDLASPTVDLASPTVDLASPTETYNGRVKSICSGTPVLTRSEFKRLPCPENFSKDICDVINFENLPDATGKYEQMYGLIKKVRLYVNESLTKADGEDNDED